MAGGTGGQPPTMDDAPKSLRPLIALAGGLAFGGLTWLLGDFGPLHALVMGLLFAAAWLAAGLVVERRRRR